ncbi:MAG: sensor histidine kinase [Methanomicrobiales archaeon]
MDDLQINLDTAIPCGLIINELVTNSLKYAFPNQEEGKISVYFNSDGDEHVLKVGDDGVGLPEDLDLDKTDTLGFQLVNSLLDQLDGKLEMETNKGTTYIMRFKDVEYKERI